MSTRRRIQVAAGLVLPVFGMIRSSIVHSDVPAEARPVVQAVEVGDWDGAQRLSKRLPERVRETPSMHYLAGRIAERREDLAAAAREYARVAGEAPGELRVDAQKRAYRTRARSGDCADAPEGPQDARMRALVAECALRQGDFSTAQTRLSEAIREDAPGVDGFALRMQLAEAQARAGALPAALATLRRAYLERPEHPDADLAVDAMRELGNVEPVFEWEERLARAERLESLLLHDRALAELALAGRPRARDELASWLHLRGNALFARRNAYREASSVLAEAARLGGAHAERDAFLAARALSRDRREPAAIRAYRAVARRYRGTETAAEAEYYAAWLELRARAPNSRRMFERFLRSANARLVPTLAREANWHLAMLDFEERRFAAAASRFAEYARSDDDVLVRARGTYWAGRAWSAANRIAAATAELRRVIAEHPLHWYALLAKQRLAELHVDAGPPLPGRARTTGAAFSPLEIPEEVRAYADLGLRNDAIAALRAGERALRERAGLRPTVETFLALGDANRAYRLTQGNDALMRPAQGDEEWVWRAAYPRAFEREVIAGAERADIEPELVWAVMRQESAYDPNALSYADAIGLLQLLPSTAERVARAAGESSSRDTLFVPEDNVRLGARYLASLIRAHGVPLAFAAYNAGGERVNEWVARSGPQDLDVFVEKIPFDQTRDYVRRVTTHYAHYLYLRDPTRWPDVALPARVGAANQ